MKAVVEANRTADAVGPPTPDAALSNAPSKTAQNGPSRSIIPARSWTPPLPLPLDARVNTLNVCAGFTLSSDKY